MIVSIVPACRSRRRWPHLLAGLLAFCQAALLLVLHPPMALAAAGVEPAGHCTPISEAQVAQLFDRWNSALASGDADRVVELYSSDALLLPTLSTEPRQTAAAIRDYFLGFLARAPQARIDSRTIRVGCDSALDAGTYSFRVGDPAAPAAGRQWVRARYSFVYAPVHGEWRIIHHHSSLQPS